MKAKFYLKSLLFLLLVFSACESDDSIAPQPFVAAFNDESIDLVSIGAQQQMNVEFSEPAQSSGVVTIKILGNNAQYGVDFSTFPVAEDRLLTLPFETGAEAVSFTFINKMLPYEPEDDQKSMLFEIVNIEYASRSSIQGYSSSLLSFDASTGATLLVEIGGPNQGDQVYIDLSKEKMTNVRRDSWDLGFYSGEDFRVAINGSIYMAAKDLGVTDIDAVTAASVQSFQNEVAIGTFDPANENYIDAPNGHINETAIAQISANNADNKVYLVNMGYSVGNTIPPVGTVAITGDPRGWKKIRILRNGEGYTLQYANLNSTTHQEVSISKNGAYNFTFFSMASQQVVNVEPEKGKWDLNFTVFTNVIDGSGSYGYSDFVVNNLKAGVKAYRVDISDADEFTNFTKSMVNDQNFQDDQRVIGADWRDVFSGTAFANRFYVLKDYDGHYYKIRMLGFLNQGGVRGYPKFEYKLLP